MLPQLTQLPDLYPTEDKYLLAISGGLDSTVLAHLLVELGYKNLELAHLNHQLRGSESEEDAQFVEQLAQDLGLNCHVETTDIEALSQSDKLSLEAAGRRARQQHWERLATELSINHIFLAQHRDDQIETILLQFFRSSGRSIGMRSPQTIGPLTYIRPLLELSKEQLRNYAKENNISYREDSSNESREFTRNRVRLDLIPQLPEVFGREIDSVLLNHSAIARDEETFFDILTEKTLSLCLNETGQLVVESLESVHLSVQRRIARLWLHANQISPVHFDHVEDILRLLPMHGALESKTAKVNLPGDKHARRKEGVIFIN